jgi:hypothetical protein
MDRTLRPLARPARSQWLNRLHYSGSFSIWWSCLWKYIRKGWIVFHFYTVYHYSAVRRPVKNKILAFGKQLFASTFQSIIESALGGRAVRVSSRAERDFLESTTWQDNIWTHAMEHMSLLHAYISPQQRQPCIKISLPYAAHFCVHTTHMHSADKHFISCMY